MRIDLEKDAGLIWGDLWYAGRYARGEASEQFQFETLIQDFTVYREERLVFRDRFVWQGPWDMKKAIWHFGTHPACGSLFVTGGVKEAILKESREYQRALFLTGDGDSCLRWLGPSEIVTKDLVETGLLLAASLAGGDGSPWLLPSHDLAPNHWDPLLRGMANQCLA